MPAGEKTEAPTPRRREELRRRGQVARSNEVSAVTGLIAAILVLRFTVGNMVNALREFTAQTFSSAATLELTPAALHTESLLALGAAVRVLGPLLVAVCIGGIVGGVSQVGFLFTTHPLKPEWQRLNPLQGLARIFSIQAVAQLAKSVAKALIVAFIIFTFLRAHGPSVVSLSSMGLTEMGRTVGQLMWGLLIRVVVALAIIAGLDYLFQRMQFEKRSRMTKPEVKEEYKRTEGDPMVKARRRQRQREIARLRMMQDVRRAKVVITNPTHIAVALRYEPKEMNAPEVVAKGQRLIAERIKEIAKECRVPIVENPPLAQALHKSVKIGEQIPPELYQAVAEVLAFVYRMSGESALPAGARI
jgi:flagellar biosynthetic protein FlhB